MIDVFGLTGKIALVTGASSGLGRHFALTLARAGASVAVAARREDKVAAVVSEIVEQGGEALAVSMDVSNRESVADAFETMQKNSGLVSILVNNAGIAGQEMAIELSEEVFDDVINTNLKGVWNVAQEGANRMVAAGQPGSIINIASILGIRVAKGVLPYAISKAGVIQMTKALALEWARFNIRVNAIAPGYVATDLNREFLESDGGKETISRIPQRRTGEMVDLEGPLLLLASDAGAYMTGAVIPVDGGHVVNSV
jgi:NAD(P)-dependent dehydrogenase (short-subunit alcohol dehydrogenase family)